MIGRLYVGDTGPLRIPVLTGDVDGTGVSSVTLRVKKPSGALATWSVTIDTATATQLNLTHTLVSGDLDESGTYILRAWLFDGAEAQLGVTALSRDLVVLPAQVPLTDPA